jgi:hypothetical protein
MADDEISLKLSKEQALVLFEWLAQVDSLDTSVFRHPAEEKVLWKLQGQLESVLSEPFAPDYNEILEAARRTVDAGEG